MGYDGQLQEQSCSVSSLNSYMFLMSWNTKILIVGLLSTTVYIVVKVVTTTMHHYMALAGLKVGLYSLTVKLLMSKIVLYISDRCVEN